MAKWFGKVGYEEEKEVRPGVWDQEVTEREYYGDTYRNLRKIQNSGEVNDTVTLANTISIVADPYAMNHFHSIRYATFSGARWKVTDVEPQYPRLLLTLGGVWNGNTPRGTSGETGGDSGK